MKIFKKLPSLHFCYLYQHTFNFLKLCFCLNFIIMQYPSDMNQYVHFWYYTNKETNLKVLSRLAILAHASLWMSVKVSGKSQFKVWCKLQFIQDPALNFTTVTHTSQVWTAALFVLMIVRYRKVQTSDRMTFIRSFITFHYMVQKLLWVDTQVWWCRPVFFMTWGKYDIQ